MPGEYMETREIVIALISLGSASLLTFFVVKWIDHLHLRDANARAKEIIDRAEREIENRRREAELEIKEEAIQQRGEGEKELAVIRQELHERERLLDKRQDALEQQSDGLRKQEKMVEGNQRKLAEKSTTPTAARRNSKRCLIRSGRPCTA